MQSHSKKPIFKFLYHYMAHSLIFPAASQVFMNWKNQRMYISSHPQSGIHILMHMLQMKNQCLLGGQHET